MDPNSPDAPPPIPEQTPAPSTPATQVPELSAPATQKAPHAVNFGDPPNDEDRLWGMLAHMVNLFAPAIGSIVVYFIYKDKSRFVAYHAMQAFVCNAILWAVSGTFIGITCGFGFPIIFVPYVLAIMWGLKANKGEWTGYPLIDGIGK